VKVFPEIMIPLVGHYRELEILREMTVRVAEAVMKSYGVTLKYLVGTMIELPRAALTADEIAQHAEFSHLGQTTLHRLPLGLAVMTLGNSCQLMWKGDIQRRSFCFHRYRWSGTAC